MRRNEKELEECRAELGQAVELLEAAAALAACGIGYYDSSKNSAPARPTRELGELAVRAMRAGAELLEVGRHLAVDPH
jgi:hypothetical protein